MDHVRNFGFLLKDVSRKYSLRFEQLAQAMSLTHSNCKVLAYLERNEGVCQSRLAELTDIDPMTMVRILDRMEADGLLERTPDPEDRRARCLYLTPKSKPVLDEIWHIADQVIEEMFTGASKSEREVFIKMLGRINHNFSLLDAPTVNTALEGQHDASAAKSAVGKSRVKRH